MARYYSKTSGDIPKKMYIHKGKHALMGPYFSKVGCEANYERIEYNLDEETGDYIRVTPIIKEVKGSKKKLDI